ncbi:DUF6221 family protein [Amycolatopsis eburnea]|uniref:Uncharacterized protein n=1 Tax=Amycolatopsis eburnea TaxID=2267691 RepID=A0A3R9KPT0_9PSEU|nr:DUF6221 family protein [Amycolatopsis eburnea]RSD21988.1 hypothetical protein EIY87_09225 [Amycolatopsis eburnea]
MGAVDDLVTWLRAQIDEDEREQAYLVGRVGRALADADLETYPGAYEARKEYYDGLAETALKAAGSDPARVLPEVEAKRKIIEAYERVSGEQRVDERALMTALKAGALRDIPQRQEAHRDTLGRRRGLELAVRLLALPYADRPGYLEAWRP